MFWLLLILTLPTENSAARMRAWRALKGCGAAVLRDGVYLLPQGDERRLALQAVAEDVVRSGGLAYLLQSQADDAALPALFDRTAEYGRLDGELDALLAEAPGLPLPDLARAARRLRKGFEALAMIDFFPGEPQRQVAVRLEALERVLRARESVQDAADEPGPHATAVVRLARADHQGRLWATRRRPWVDRLASAWLIRRFIDPAARMLWLATPADCPADALGFDFDGATFSHTPAFVTFETLLYSFALETDPALLRLAQVVHYLDVGGLPVADAPGLKAVLSGLRRSIADDDALLAAASHTFDSLYVHYGDTQHDQIAPAR